jgi:hypothetical protein
MKKDVLEASMVSKPAIIIGAIYKSMASTCCMPSKKA